MRVPVAVVSLASLPALSPLVAAMTMMIAAPPASADAAACMMPVGADGLPPALSSSAPERARATLKPGAKVELGGVSIAIEAGLMPAFVGSTQGERVVRAEVRLPSAKDGATSKNTAESILPASMRLGGVLVSFDEAGKAAGEAFDVRVIDIGCDEEATGGPMAKGETRTLWLSTRGVSRLDLFAGDDSTFTDDQLQLNLTSGLSENTTRKIVADDAGVPLTPCWTRLSAFERNKSTNQAVDLAGPALLAAAPRMQLAEYVLDVKKVVHGPRSKIKLKEIYAPADPVISVLVRVTRTK